MADKDPDIGLKFVALAEHVGASDAELSFGKGASIILIRKEGDWWVGEHDGDIGKLPSKKVAREVDGPKPEVHSSPDSKGKNKGSRRGSLSRSGSIKKERSGSLKGLRKLSSISKGSVSKEDFSSSELGESSGALELLNKPHSWVTQQLNKFTWCAFCNEFVWGLVLQGLRCSQCEAIIHRKCKFHVPDDCGNPCGSLQRGRNVVTPQLTKGNETGVAHVFELHHFSRYTHCAFCTEFIYGLGKQGYKCVLCSYPIHKDCLPLALNKEDPLKNCTARIGGGTYHLDRDTSDTGEESLSQSQDRMELIRSTQLKIEREMGIGEDVSLVEFDSEGEWNSLFGTLESETTIEESDLQGMMELIQKTEGEVKKLERQLRDTGEVNDEYRSLAKTVMLKTAEVQLAKAKVTEIWDLQNPQDDPYNKLEDTPPPLPKRENPFSYDEEDEK